MKNILAILTLVFLANVSWGQEISFQHEGWENILAEAKKDNKLIFLDAYTTWCGPCKYMSREVFTDKGVADYYNETFVNAKFDMEKGEGLVLAKNFKVRAYPTLLFINGDGEVVHKGLGARGIDDFLMLGKSANNPATQMLALKTRYESGDLSDEVTKNYSAILRDMGSDDYEEVASIYLTNKDWSKKENIQFLFDYSKPSLTSDLFVYSVKNRAAFEEIVGAEQMQMKVDYAAEVDAAANGVDMMDQEAITRHLFDYYDDAEATKNAKKLYLSNIMYSKDPVIQEEFKVDAQLLLADEPALGSQFYNSVAWEVHLLTSDNGLLERCSRWADISIEEEKNFYNTDTKASIEYKLKNKQEALKWANEAIRLAQETNQNPSETQALLEKIMKL